MQNHVRNVIKMQGITELPLFTTCDDGTKAFDFNKLIPMPKSLELEAGSLEDVAIEAALRKLGKGTTMSDERYAERRKHYAKATDEELEKLGLQYISNSILYGHTTWYHWCIENWDTKWNAYDNKTVNNGCIKFSTAWSSPEKVIEKLAEKYPEAKIEHWWADEDTGSNTGYKAYENGRETENSVGYFNNGSQEALNCYKFCWGKMPACFHKTADGQWTRHDCEGCTGCQ